MKDRPADLLLLLLFLINNCFSFFSLSFFFFFFPLFVVVVVVVLLYMPCWARPLVWEVCGNSRVFLCRATCTAVILATGMAKARVRFLSRSTGPVLVCNSMGDCCRALFRAIILYPLW